MLDRMEKEVKEEVKLTETFQQMKQRTGHTPGQIRPSQSSTSSSSKKKESVKKDRVDTSNPEQVEKVLRSFDLNSKYGPCIGMTRMERWERAHNLGLCPPEDIRTLLTTKDIIRKEDCLWEGRI